MAQISSSLTTLGDQIPLVNKTEIWKSSGLHMHFETLADLISGVNKEIANGANAIWFTGQPISVASEPVGLHRVWNTSLQHARTVVIRPGLVVILAANTNTVLSTSGVPSAGTGSNGDLAVDFLGNNYYTKSAGTWSSANTIYSGGSSTTVIDSLISTSTTSALSANQGKALKDTADALATTVGNKQETLVSTTNIKTINGTTLLGSGDIVVSGGTGVSIANNLTTTVVGSALDATQGKALKDTADSLATTVGNKQETLVSTTNIKTINGTTLLGSGDIIVSSGASVSNTTPTSLDVSQSTNTASAGTSSDAARADHKHAVYMTGVAAGTIPQVTATGFLASALFQNQTTNNIEIAVGLAGPSETAFLIKGGTPVLAPGRGVTISGSNSTSAASALGGAVSLIGGTGTGTVAAGKGGLINLTGGTAVTFGGDVNLTGGATTSTTTGTPGKVIIRGGTAASTTLSSGGQIQITGGTGNIGGSLSISGGVSSNISTGVAGNTTVSGGAAAGGPGGNATISGGFSSSGVAGNAFLLGGTGSQEEGGTDGKAYIGCQDVYAVTAGAYYNTTSLLYEPTLGFNGATPSTKKTISGDRQCNTGLTALLESLAEYGIITNSTTDSGNITGSALAMTVQPLAPTTLQNGGTLTLRGQNATAATLSGGGVSIIGGNPFTTGLPGNVTIQAPNSSTSVNNSGFVSIVCGLANANASNYVELAAGAGEYSAKVRVIKAASGESVNIQSGTGGILSISGGSSNSALSAGPIYLTGGTNNSNGDGGGFSATGGNGGTSSNGGGLTFTGGFGNGTGKTGGGGLLEGGFGSAGANGGSFTIQGGSGGDQDNTGNGGNVSIIGGLNTSTVGGNGGSVTIQGGNIFEVGVTAAGNGGSVTLAPGIGQVKNGEIYLTSVAGVALRINDDGVGATRIGFFAVAPTLRPNAANTTAATVVASSGTALNDASTFDGYTLAKVVKALRNLGLLN